MPEVAAEQAADEAEVLQVERLIQAPAVPQLRDIGGVRAGLGLHRDGVAGQSDQPEDYRHQEPQRDDAVQRSHEDIPFHAALSGRP